MVGGKSSEASSSNSNNSSSKALSVVVDCGRRRSSCGYCKSSGHTSISHGLWAHSLTVNDYQDLVDRGWRRSGCFLYKPEMEKTCCPSYTIRLKASDFTPSKEQRRVIRRMQRFLDGTLDLAKDNMVGPSTSARAASKVHNTSSSCSKASTSAEQKEAEISCYLSENINNVVQMYYESGEFSIGSVLPKASVKKVLSVKKKILVEGSEELLYTSNIAFQIAAALRRAQSADKGVDQSRQLRPCSEENGPSPKTIAEKLVVYLNQQVETPGLSVKACNGHINFCSASNQASLAGSLKKVVTDKSAREHGNGRNSIKNLGYPLTKRRKLELRLKRSTFDPEEFALFRRYQMKVHNDTEDHVTESSYRRFLVDTPLIYLYPTDDGTVPSCGFGSFHQQYVIDGHLVAVGVIDILPNCLSSKYLFWDPDYAFLSLGKYSAFQEIEWVKKNQVDCPSLQYYYLGYYIHSCRKMRYKAAYHPSELLCPLRYQWVPFDIAKPLLDRSPYVVLSDFPLQHAEFSLLTEKISDTHHDDSGEDDANEISMDEDEEMVDPDSDSIYDESDQETSDLASGYTDGGHVGNILIGLNGSYLRYKDLQSAFGAKDRSYLESQLRRFKTVVGAELYERMVYSLG